jgi:hypothetical protein
MKYITKVALIVKGDRVRKGKEVDLTKEEAAAFGDDLTPLMEDAPEPEPEPEKAVKDMNAKELAAKATALGLSAAGTKADLLERITLHEGATITNE